MKIYYLKIPYYHQSIDLEIRHLLEDTLEDRGLGEVINVGTGEGYFDMTIQCPPESIPQIKSLLLSIGMGEAKIEEVD